MQNTRISIVIPAFKVKDQILQVIASVPAFVSEIIVVDDACPEKTGSSVSEKYHDKRVKVLIHPRNIGVGGAMKTGYKEALKNKADIIVKIDGDGQMNLKYLNSVLEPLLKNQADYTKGNRFFYLSGIKKMPIGRIIGNLFLSFITKISSGYHNIFDPNNGFTAIRAHTLKQLNLNNIDDGYFFESDMLFNLYTVRAVVRDVPMSPQYGDEKSNLKIYKIALPFFLKNIRNTLKRIVYSYYVRDFNVASIEIPLGVTFFGFGTYQGISHWIKSMDTNLGTPLGTQIIVTICILIGFQLLLSFITYDLQNIPYQVISEFDNER
jgi:glycosyltransferase involved in cell wall biosynthesis